MPSKFDIIMVRSKRKSLFGGAAPFSKAQLPTYLDVGKQFLQSKLELQGTYLWCSYDEKILSLKGKFD